jgi:hypothetical protein
MTNWQIEENDSVYEYLERPEVNIGDTIEIMSNNQLGYKKYKVILGENGDKDLRTIADWSLDIFEEHNNEDDGMTDDEQDGGKKKRKHRSKHTRRGNVRKHKKNKKSRKNRRSRRH